MQLYWMDIAFYFQVPLLHDIWLSNLNLFWQ